MQLLKQLLQADNVEILNLEDEIKALGFDPSNLSDDDALTVAAKLKEKHANKLSKSRGKKSDKSEVIPGNLSVEVATDKAVKKVDEIVAQYQTLADKVVTKKSDAIIAIIENIPNATMSRVRQLLDDSEGNLDFFLNEIDDVETNFLSKFGIE